MDVALLDFIPPIKRNASEGSVESEMLDVALHATDWD